MDSSSKPVTLTPGQHGTSAMSDPLLSDPLEKLHSQTDSFLTAARLVRRGWTRAGKKTEWQFSHVSSSTSQTSLTRSDQICAEICPKDSRSHQVPAENSEKTTDDGQMHSEKKSYDAKPTSEGEFLANRETGRQTGLSSQVGVVYVWASGCRNKCRQSRRLKAPLLPVIAEI